MAEVEVPTRDELAQLPRWAIVAFAARCARRVQPLFTQSWPDAPQHHVIAVENAIALSEKRASSGKSNSLVVPGVIIVSGGGVYAAARAAYTAYAASTAATAAARAADAAAYAARAADAADAADAAARAADAVRAADAATKAARHAVNASPIQIILSSIRNDFACLLEASRRENWDDTTPVPPSFFEPLELFAPTLMPADPLESDEQVVMVLQGFGEPGVSANTLAEHLLAVYKALNQYTLAKYGRHLSRGRFRRLVLLHSGVPA